MSRFIQPLLLSVKFREEVFGNRQKSSPIDIRLFGSLALKPMSLSNHKPQVMHYLSVDTFRWSTWRLYPYPPLPPPTPTTPLPPPTPTTPLPPPIPCRNNGLERSQFIHNLYGLERSQWPCQWLVMYKCGAGAGDGSKHPHPHKYTMYMVLKEVNDLASDW